MTRSKRGLVRRWKVLTLQVHHAAATFGLGNWHLAELYVAFGIDCGALEAPDEDGGLASDIPLLVSDTSSEEGPPTGAARSQLTLPSSPSTDSDAPGNSD